MIEYMDITSVTPASYNPRKITEGQFENLKSSILSIGCVVPILVNSENNVIIAGHQRTKAMKACGVKSVPVVKIKGLGIGDEIKFNQIHNGIDYRNTAPTKLLSDNEEIEKFIQLDVSKFKIGDTTPTVVKEVCKLIIKYGNVLSCVVCEGRVYLGHNYVDACRVLNLPVNSYICTPSKRKDIELYFSQDYGQYSYDGIERKTYVQGLAQMHRLGSAKEGGRLNKSCLYENMVLPNLNENVKSILDFGCGKGAYITMLKKQFDAIGVEFYNNNGSAINVTKGNNMIDELIAHLKTKGLFDVVVCDSVLNSVDSVEAENSVIGCLNLFCKENGKMFISGRPIDVVRSREKIKRDTSNKLRYIEYLDEDNFTANYRRGQWYFQHFNDKENLIKKLERLGFRVEKVFWGSVNSTSFQVECTKIKNLTAEEYKKAVEFEFNLPLPNNKRYGRHKEVLKALELMK